MSSDNMLSASTAPTISQANNKDLIFANALSAAWRARTWLFNPDLALRKDVNFREKVMRHPKLAMAVQNRTHAIATREWSVEAGDEEESSKVAADVVKAILKRIPKFSQARLRLAWGPFQGNANEWIECRRTRGVALARTAPQDWLTVTGLREVDYRRVRLFPRWTTGIKPFIEEVELHLGGIVNNGQYEKIEHPELLMRVVHGDQESRLGYGYPIFEALYYALWIIEKCMQEGLEGVEKWASGWVVGTVDQSPFGATDKTSELVATALFEAIQMMRASGVILVGKGETVDVKETTGTGHVLVSWFIEHMEDAAVQLATGSLRPTGGGEGGTYGQGKVEERASDEVVKTDRDTNDEAITSSLIGLIWRHNRPQFEAVAPGAAMPRFISVEGDDESPVDFLAVADGALNKLRIPLDRAETYKRLGLTRPADDEDAEATIQPPQMGLDGKTGDPFSDLADAQREAADKKDAAKSDKS